MSNHVNTLEAIKNHPELNEGGTILAMVGDAIRALLEENERLEDEKRELARMHNALEDRIEAVWQQLTAEADFGNVDPHAVGRLVKALRGEE